MAGHCSFGQQLLYPPTISILYVGKLNKLSCLLKYFTTESMWSYGKEANTETPPLPYDTSQRYLQHLSMCAYRIKIRSSCPLSDSNSNAYEILVEVPLSNFNCFDACYNTNIATDNCFETLQSSIWKTNWSLYNLWHNTVKWKGNFYSIDFKRLLQYLNLCNKTNKCSFIKCVSLHIINFHFVRFGKRNEMRITCEKVLSNDWAVL